MKNLPERAVQFGTGAFLRGFIEFFIDEANRNGIFNGRIVAIGSTGSGRDKAINEQKGVFTLAIRGIENGKPTAEYRTITSLSRALSAVDEWPDVLELARNRDVEYVFSNTTETGIRLDENDKLSETAPSSFPGKLTAFLFERGRTFDYAPTAAPIVIPCELIEDNGTELKRIVLELARRWQLDSRFAQWIETQVTFCNTLVDRIVPGGLSGREAEDAQEEIGYQDELLTACEPYRLFAIESSKPIEFAAADPNIIVCDDIAPYRERKVRLLNGTHTIMVPAALLAGCETVRGAMEDEEIGGFVRRVLFDELVPSIDADGAEKFATEVVDRFLNPYINHALLDITLQQTMKLRVRIVPAIVELVSQGRSIDGIAFGFASYLELLSRDMPLREDSHAAAIKAASTNEVDDYVRAACGNSDVWGVDLNTIGDFALRVAEHLRAVRVPA